MLTIDVDQTGRRWNNGVGIEMEAQKRFYTNLRYM